MVKTAVSVPTAARVGALALNAVEVVETTVTLSPSTPHPATNRHTQHNKNRCNRVITSSQNYDFAKKLYMHPSDKVIDDQIWL